MTKARVEDLSYGRIGDANYDVDSAQWNFQRPYAAEKSLQPVGPECVIMDSVSQSSTTILSKTVAIRLKGIHEILKDEPSLTPSTPLLASFAQVSEAANDASVNSDPLVSDRFAFGTAADYHDHTFRLGKFKIIAVAGGLGGEVLTLAEIRKSYFGWEADKGIQIATWGPSKTNEVRWIGSGSPIQQICCSVVEGQPGQWLAVRDSGSTTILRPLMHRAPVPSFGLKTYSKEEVLSPPSCLEANPVIFLPNSQTGGATLVDIVFNPFYESQFATLNLTGHWSVWNIDLLQRRRGLWHATSLAQGNLSSFDLPGADSGVADGWGTVLWVGDTTTIIVANRVSLNICSIKSPQVCLRTPDIGLSDGSWVLDMKRSPSNTSHVFVLTSLRIVWLQIHPEASDRADSDPQQLSTCVLLSWRHFRNPDDNSLRLAVDGMDTGVLALLYSKASNLVTAYNFGLSLTTGLPQLASSPFIVTINGMSMPLSHEDKDSSIGMSPFTLLLKRPEFIDKSKNSKGPGRGFINSEKIIYQLFVIYGDLRVTVRLYVHSSQYGKPENLPLFSLGKKKNSVTKTPSKVDDEDFIVLDGLDSEGEQETFASTRPSETRSEPHSSGGEDPWTLNLDWVPEAIEQQRTLAADNSCTWESFVNSTQALFVDFKEKDCRILSLLEIFLDRFPMGDIDNVSRMLQEVLNSIDEGSLGIDETSQEEPNQRLTTVPLTNPNNICTLMALDDEQDDMRLLPTYEKLLRLWVSSLAPKVPGRSRVNLDKEVRQVAIQLYLASHGIRSIGEPLEDPQLPTLDTLDSSQIVLPLRRKRSAIGLPNMFEASKEKIREQSPLQSSELPFRGSSQQHQTMLPTPENTPSLHSRRSSASHGRTQYSAYEGLKHVASLVHQEPLSDSMTTLIHHWDIGTNPADYDWERNCQSLNNQSDLDGTEDEASAKRRRRIRRHLKRNRVESVGTSSQLTTRGFSSSQPQVQGPPPVISSQAVETPRIGSQSERGLHGASQSFTMELRPLKKARPDRVRGF